MVWHTLISQTISQVPFGYDLHVPNHTLQFGYNVCMPHPTLGIVWHGGMGLHVTPAGIPIPMFQCLLLISYTYQET